MVDEKMYVIFKGVKMIIHAGDIGRDVLSELETIAPVVAVEGNMDYCLDEKTLKPIEILEINDKKIMVTHIFGYPRRISQTLKELREKVSPDVIIFGHSHIPVNESVDSILYLNPGSAGPAKLAFKRSVAILSVTQENVWASIIYLE